MSFLTEQIGPLPGGAWLGVIGGGLAIGFLGRRRSAKTAAAVPVPADTPQDQSTYGAVQLAGPTGTTTMGTPKFANNQEWASAAVAYLIGRGTLASRATNAISHILYPDASNPTTSEDSALYNLAAGGVGLPPSLPSQAYIPDPPATGPPPSALVTQFANGYVMQWDPADAPGGIPSRWSQIKATATGTAATAAIREFYEIRNGQIVKVG